MRLLKYVVIGIGLQMAIYGITTNDVIVSSDIKHRNYASGGVMTRACYS